MKPLSETPGIDEQIAQKRKRSKDDFKAALASEYGLSDKDLIDILVGRNWWGYLIKLPPALNVERTEGIITVDHVSIDDVGGD